MNQSKQFTRAFILTLAGIFCFLLYHKSPGLNYSILSLITIGAWLWTRTGPTSVGFVLLTIGLVLSGQAVVLGHSSLSIFMFWFSFAMFIGTVHFTQIKHLQYAPNYFLYSLSQARISLINGLSGGNQSSSNWKNFIRFFFLPAFTLIILVSIYASANEFFGESFKAVWQSIKNFFSDFSFDAIFLYALGLILFSFFLVKTYSEKLVKKEQALEMELVRKRKKPEFKKLNRFLLRQQQVAVAFFIIINIILAWQNFLEIKNVWFGFTWTGQLLKGFVHEGTYLLLFALLISIAITVYYLNGNLLFMKNNGFFKALVIMWLAQNLLMVIAVAVRNTYYVQFYALAYKRIFIYFFLFASAIAIFSIIYKILYKKSIAFLLSTNSVSIYYISILAACFNWDGIIAQYNFTHSDKAYLHYEFMLQLNDAALPWLSNDSQKLKVIDSLQYSRFPVKVNSIESNFGSQISSRKASFIKEFEEKSWLEWNLPEQRAYHILVETGHH
ncbi:MAG: DUF4153 domain-containing protein [Bacteroidia bacterium]